MEARRGTLGNTPLIYAKELGNFLKLDNLYIKYEGTNPTGTQKDRSALLQVERAAREGYDTIVAASCGNYGASIAYYASMHNLAALIYIPKGSHSIRLREISGRVGTSLVTVEGLYEESVERSRKDARDNEWFDGNAGTHPEVGLEAFSKISEEIVDSLGFSPQAVSVPVGNGTTLAGIYHGFERLVKVGRSKVLPKMIAASTDGGNPIVESFRRGKMSITDVPREMIKESEVNEPLVNFHSYDGDLALDALIKSEGYAEYVTDEELRKFRDLIEKFEKIDVIPAAAASIAAIVHVEGTQKIPGVKVAVLTG